MKTYTLDQFKIYLSKQDSMGDILYNLPNIDKYLINNEIRLIESSDELNDFLVDLEYHQNKKFEWEDVIYEVSDNVTDFIREYGEDRFSQITEMEEFIQHGLIEEICIY